MNNQQYMADTNMNTLLEGGMATEIEFQSEQQCCSAEEAYIRRSGNSRAVILGSSTCIEMVKQPDGCMDCQSYVECMLPESAQPIQRGSRYKEAVALKRVLNRLCK